MENQGAHWGAWEKLRFEELGALRTFAVAATMDELYGAAKVCRVARVMQPYLESIA